EWPRSRCCATCGSRATAQSTGRPSRAGRTSSTPIRICAASPWAPRRGQSTRACRPSRWSGCAPRCAARCARSGTGWCGRDGGRRVRPAVDVARPARRRAARPGAARSRDAGGVVMAVIEREAKIVNPLGMHARPAAEFVKLASRFKCGVEVKKDDLAVNGKSIMGVMMLAAECGSSLIIRTDGEDAERAMEALLALVADGFHEMHPTAEVREALPPGLEGQGRGPRRRGRGAHFRRPAPDA